MQWVPWQMMWAGSPLAVGAGHVSWRAMTVITDQHMDILFDVRGPISSIPICLNLHKPRRRERAMLWLGLGARVEPHVVRRAATTGTGGVSVAPRTTSLPVSTASGLTGRALSPLTVRQSRIRVQRPLSTRIGSVAASRGYGSHHYRMASQELDTKAPQEVRKYLQQSHDRIFENNKKWVAEMKGKHPEFFENLSAGQSPEYLWIGESPPSAFSVHEIVLLDTFLT
jgi:hypothetical protein